MKMPESIETIMFAPYGMNCKVCYKHCYHRKPCAGCLTNNMDKPEHCRKYKIKDCVQSKNLNYCFECLEFPCKQIRYLEKSYNKRYQASLIENSEFVQKHGLEKLWSSRKKGIPVQNAVASSIFMTKNATIVKKK